MTSIDLNADVGEGEPAEDALLDIVSSCSIACGGHAGDATSMARTIAAARLRGVTTGAHPSYPDRAGFGRRSGFLAGERLFDALTHQVREFARIAADAGVRTAHVKLHGALYNEAARDRELAGIAARVVAALPGDAALVGPPDSELASAARHLGVRFLAEGFVDRRYRPDGTLVPRSEAGAVLETVSDAVAQALSLAREHRVMAQDGSRIVLRADTLCIHGDTPGAAETAAAIRRALVAAGVRIAPPASIAGARVDA